jgi:DNA-binding FadR family transcriptional regulator
MVAAEGQPNEFSRADIEFHTLVLKAGHNSFLSRLAPLVEILITTTLDLYSEGGWDAEHIERASIPLHGALADAIVGGDAPGADNASRLIIERARSDMSSALHRMANVRPARSTKKAAEPRR